MPLLLSMMVLGLLPLSSCLRLEPLMKLVQILLLIRTAALAGMSKMMEMMMERMMAVMIEGLSCTALT